MTIREICSAIETETHTKTWELASYEAHLEVIEALIHQLSAEPEQAAKKVKQRKPRTQKPKAAPLTQHAEASE